MPTNYIRIRIIKLFTVGYYQVVAVWIIEIKIINIYLYIYIFFAVHIRTQ
jgi:hypothetical protein